MFQIVFVEVSKDFSGRKGFKLVKFDFLSVPKTLSNGKDYKENIHLVWNHLNLISSLTTTLTTDKGPDFLLNQNHAAKKYK